MDAATDELRSAKDATDHWIRASNSRTIYGKFGPDFKSK